MLHRLPTELALHILAHIPLKSLANSAAVSKEWSQLVSINELQIYRNAAVLHGFVPPQATVDADIASKAGGWKELCKRVLQYERSWRGHAPVTPKELSAGGKSVHRIKVDEERRIVITTIQRGGLYVTDLDTNIVLWSLPRGYIAEFVHCEYECGFLVFTRPDSCYEVWCAVDRTDVQPSEIFPPNDFQDQIAQVAGATHVTSPARARFRPHALLRCPEPTRALRLSYPTLFVAGTNSAFLWDIVSGTLVQTLTELQRRPGNLGIVRYVEVTPDYAIICGSESFRMFSREDGSVAFMLQQDDFPKSKRRVMPAENTAHELAPMKIGPAARTSGSEEFMAGKPLFLGV
ncbi:hypothetical protein CONPUDRAFT_45080 [Coniophora puteana RWD-64-598 SS2]|uniref:F-box domain-containing protein n=1 Tax=Coniophora puteana (strain RWD-64-598) TaxID=741705 RepID=A0A5M3N7R2_CONPW|nr:uncharacterized protein CONPUDRAFT_45080 [Coniophora puteana RWD-64-598 SS2]EIW87328.1 hypothetical protein CONPUDRAFT_45080 [Coniophora puteana RWD-64-598 SS2]